MMVLPAVQRLALAAVAALMPSLAFAHTGGGDMSGFAHGFVHPFTGLDHLLAMTLVGILASQLGRRAFWRVPASFVAVMALGGILGAAGLGLPLVELGIALSVVVLGGVVALAVRAPVAAAMGVVALFAVFHGLAHGAEMPENAAGLAYGLGFMIATALLHTSGVGMGLLIGRAGSGYGTAIVRSAGGLAAIAGIAVLTGIL